MRLIFGILIQIICLSGASRATVMIKSGSVGLTASATPANFGPSIPSNGVFGIIMPTEPKEACSTVKPIPNISNSPTSTSKPVPWVALIKRSQTFVGNCTFNVKVNNAAKAGAIAAIVYDDVYEPLITMSRPSEGPDPDIPSVFISLRTGEVILHLIEGGETYTEIYPDETSNTTLSLIISVFSALLAILTLMAGFMIAKRRHSILAMRHGVEQQPGGGAEGAAAAARRGMTEEQLNKLPVIIYKGKGDLAGEDKDAAGGGGAATKSTIMMMQASSSAEKREEFNSVDDDIEKQQQDGQKDEKYTGWGTLSSCTICLEKYEDGEKLRILPCQHRYHKQCIDVWLVSRKPLCPVCKCDATFTNTAAIDGGDGDGDGGGSSSSSRSLLTSGGDQARHLWNRLTGGRDRASPSDTHEGTGSPTDPNLTAPAHQPLLVGSGAGSSPASSSTQSTPRSGYDNNNNSSPNGVSTIPLVRIRSGTGLSNNNNNENSAV